MWRLLEKGRPFRAGNASIRTIATPWHAAGSVGSTRARARCPSASCTGRARPRGWSQRGYRHSPEPRRDRPTSRQACRIGSRRHHPLRGCAGSCAPTRAVDPETPSGPIGTRGMQLRPLRGGQRVSCCRVDGARAERARLADVAAIAELTHHVAARHQDTGTTPADTIRFGLFTSSLAVACRATRWPRHSQASSSSADAASR